MKNFSTNIVISAMAFFVLTHPLVAATPSPAYGTKTAAESLTADQAKAMEGADAVTAKKPEYLLPFPGILPDHPLYVLKSLRDWILEVLIVDPLRKGEFYLLQADKRLAMGIAYDGKNMMDKTVESVTLAEQHMGRAMDQFLVFKNSGSQVPGSTVDRLEQSMVKHSDMITSYITKATDAQKQALVSALTKIQTLQGEVGKLK